MSGIPTLNTTTDNARASGGYQEWATAGFLVVSIMITKVAIWLRRICVMTVLHVFYAINVWNWFPSFSLGWNVAREAFF